MLLFGIVFKLWYIVLLKPNNKLFFMLHTLNTQHIDLALSRNTPKVVITHRNCMDGCLCKALWGNYLEGQKTQYVELDYSDLSPDINPQRSQELASFFLSLDGHDVMLSDFSLPIEWMRTLAANNHSLIWTDHHHSALPNLQHFLNTPESAQNVSIVFDEHNTFSGAALTHMALQKDKDLAEVVALVSDGDVWRFEHGVRTKHFYQGIRAQFGEPKNVPFSFWKSALSDAALVEQVCATGAPIYQSFLQQVQAFAQTATPITLKGIGGWMACVPKEFVSEVGAHLARERGGFALLYQEDPNTGSVKCSLRSDTDLLHSTQGTAYSMNTLAECFGGGGHKRAAAFLCTSFASLLALDENRVHKTSFLR